jgi:hypothetical protein
VRFQLLRAISSRDAPAARGRPWCRAPWFSNRRKSIRRRDTIVRPADASGLRRPGWGAPSPRESRRVAALLHAAKRREDNQRQHQSGRIQSGVHSAIMPGARDLVKCATGLPRRDIKRSLDLRRTRFMSTRHHREAIERCRSEPPDVYVRVVAGLLPKQTVGRFALRAAATARPFTTGASAPSRTWRLH